MTCADCKHRNYCIESSRMYPCRDFEADERSTRMKEKPVLFNAEMVKAILDGKKTVTRRVVKPQPKSRICYSFAGSRGMAGTWGYPGSDAWKYWGEEYKLPKDLSEADKNQRFTPPCHTDDILYVRETWAPLFPDSESDQVVGYLYKADRDIFGKEYQERYDKQYPNGKNWTWSGIWKPSIHMPKEAARIWLKVINVKIEKLQDMTVNDATKEGSTPLYVFEDDTEPTLDALNEFRRTWNSTISNKDLSMYGWDANPWVWVIEFERIENRRRIDD